MSGFLKENWLWVALPIALGIAVLIFLVYFFEGDTQQPFIYNIS